MDKNTTDYKRTSLGSRSHEALSPRFPFFAMLTKSDQIKKDAKCGKQLRDFAKGCRVSSPPPPPHPKALSSQWRRGGQTAECVLMCSHCRRCFRGEWMFKQPEVSAGASEQISPSAGHLTVNTQPDHALATSAALCPKELVLVVISFT